MASKDGPVKVFLWAVPHSMSMSFLKCMTFVPEAVAWHEPYLQLRKFSNKIDDPVQSDFFHEMVEKHGGAPAVAKIESGYDASDKDFDWLKDQLETDYPEKKLVFVKEISMSIFMQSDKYLDKIPAGFRHTFLIRHPQNMMMSMAKMMMSMSNFTKPQQSGGLENLFNKDNVRPMQHLNDILKYVKSQGLETNPVIIDSDELLESPKAILEAYCKEVGIPYTEDLLTWEAGDDVFTKQWMVPKQTILTFRTIGAHKGTFASTGFKKPVVVQDAEAMEQLLKQVPSNVLEGLKEIVARDVPYYQEMFAQRLTVS